MNGQRARAMRACPLRGPVRRGVLRFAALSACALSPMVMAQPDRTPMERPIPTSNRAAGLAATVEPLTVTEKAGRVGERVALLDLRLLESPRPEDYRRTLALLSLAGDLSPGDAELARRMAEAAFAVGDPDLLIDATTRVVRADPEDTVAQLRLIVSRIARMQTVDERLAAYDRFLGPQGSKFDASIRSRLALDAALLHRERGEGDRFVERLTQATSLDPTNKEAATLALNYFVDQLPDDPVGRLRLELNLLYADPFDPNVHMSIAFLLAREGALPQTARFHTMGMALLNEANRVGPERDVERLALGWQLQGPNAVVAEIDRRLEAERAAAQAVYERDVKLDVPDSELVPPETVHLDALYEKMRVLAALSAGDFLQVERGLEELRAIAQEKTTILRDPTRKVDPETESRLIFETTAALADLQLMRAIANVQLEEFAAETQGLGQLGREFQNALAPLAAWLRFRNGDAEGAIEAADRIEARNGPTPPLDILRGLASESLGSVDRAVEIYRGLIDDDPLGPIGAWARNRMLGLLNIRDPRTDAGRAMGPLADAVPDYIERMLGNVNRFMDFTVEVVQETVPPGEPVRVRIKLANISPFPLGLGPDRPLNSRVVLIPKLDSRAEFIGRPQPEVIDLNRRLRLGPRESLVVETDVGVGLTGLLGVVNAPLLNRQRWRAVQGFRVSDLGAFEPGPLCRADDTRAILVQAHPSASGTPAELIDLLRASERDRLPDLIESAASMFYRSEAPAASGRDPGTGPLRTTDQYATDSELAPPPGAFSAAELAPLAGALAELYRESDAEIRAMILGQLPSAAMARAMQPFDEAMVELANDRVELAQGEPEPAEALEIGLLIVTRLTDAKHPLIDAALNGPNADLRAIAQAARSRLTAGRATYATAGPGINALGGPTRRTAIERVRSTLGL